MNSWAATHANIGPGGADKTGKKCLGRSMGAHLGIPRCMYCAKTQNLIESEPPGPPTKSAAQLWAGVCLGGMSG